MKLSLVIFVILLVIPLVNSKDISIPEVFETKDKVIPGGETTYFYAGSKLVASKNDDTITYHYQDRLGSDVESKSLPFGQSLKIGKRFSFTGKELDSDLYYFNARYYDSSLGRFTSVDPIKDNHAYNYVSNNPMNYIDPSGMDEDEVQYVCGPPETGPEVEYYNVYIEYYNPESGDYGEIFKIKEATGESAFVSFTSGVNYWFRIYVSGVDFDGDEGPRSPPSEFFDAYNQVSIEDIEDPNNPGEIIQVNYGITNLYPNPSNPQSGTTIDYSGYGQARITISDLKGRMLRTEDIFAEIGESNSYFWNQKDSSGRNLPSGAYFVNINFKELDIKQKPKKLTILK